LGFDPDRQRPKKAQVFGNLSLGDSLTLTVRDEDAVGDFKCPDFRDDGVVRYQFLENPAAVRGILGRIARKEPRNRDRGIEDECQYQWRYPSWRRPRVIGSPRVR
jgi:hypothetical protein